MDLLSEPAQGSTIPATKRYALVTGASRGIGFEVCKQLASEGIVVLLTDRDEKKGLEAIGKLKDLGISDDNLVFHQLDVAEPDSIASLVDFTRNLFGKLDILVNNAGIGGFAPHPGELKRVFDLTGDFPMGEQVWNGIAAQTYELAEACIKTNYYGARAMAEAFAPLLQSSDSGEWAKGVLADVESLTEEMYTARETKKSITRGRLSLSTNFALAERNCIEVMQVVNATSGKVKFRKEDESPPIVMCTESANIPTGASAEAENTPMDMITELANSPTDMITEPTKSPMVMNTKQAPLSYKDKLTSGSNGTSIEEENATEEALTDDDVVIKNDEQGPFLLISDKAQEHFKKAWKYTVIVKLLGRNIGYNMLYSKIKTLWKPSSDPKIVDMENGYYLVKFNNSGDMVHAMAGGPWVVLGHYLTVQLWYPEFQASTATASRVVAWLRFPDMSPLFYHERVLKKIGNMVGKIIKIDNNTIEAQRGKFARVAVELDLSRPLLPKFRINGKWQKIEYENLPQVCFKCGRVGHESAYCVYAEAEKNRTTSDSAATSSGGNRSQNTQAAPTSTTPEKLPEEAYGPWIHAARRPRRNPQKEKEITGQLERKENNVLKLGSRFSALTTNGEDPLVEKGKGIVGDKTRRGVQSMKDAVTKMQSHQGK